ncbi:DUF6232 family protein [Streptomyces marincola]|uniref:DUF6232 family protein n=1 Tax=Streptomyces marincola TaxID=2878388 RepID=UPI001CF15184|nr:DUF6232 family protein [Streptomyces marincola]UCM90443.1 DUF6232 family protein [Streptomyces marincola]
MAKGVETTVQVSRKILWVTTRVPSPPGLETMVFPLDNVARVTVTPYRPDRMRALLKFLVLLLLLRLLVTLLAGGAGEAVANAVEGVAAVVTLGLTVQLLIVLTRRSYFVLLVETTGPPFARLYSRDEQLMQRVGAAIVAALDNPQVAFHYRIEHFQIGDTIKLIGGSGNTGKVNQ